MALGAIVYALELILGGVLPGVSSRRWVSRTNERRKERGFKYDTFDIYSYYSSDSIIESLFTLISVIIIHLLSN